VIVEESPERLANIADYVYLIESGGVVFEGRPQALLEDRAVLTTYLG
jgi:ABC-type branched-subunit amino acid transport system ATPase component